MFIDNHKKLETKQSHLKKNMSFTTKNIQREIMKQEQVMKKIKHQTFPRYILQPNATSSLEE